METLDDLLKRSGNHFPIVIKSSTDLLKSVFLHQQLGEVIHIVLEKQLDIPFAHVKVLPAEDELIKKKESEDDWFLIYNTYTDEDLLIPLRYPGELKTVHNRRRYVTTSQILFHPPRFVKVGGDIVTLDETGKCKPIASGSTLEIKNAELNEKGKVKVLKCKNKKGESFDIDEMVRINFVGLPDSEVYTLQKLVDTAFLPKVVRFQNVPREDIVEADTDRAGDLSIILEGNIQLQESKIMKVAVISVQDVYNDVSKIVLVPETLWTEIAVQSMEFNKADDRTVFLAEHVICKDTSFFEEKLFFMNDQPMDIIRLKNPYHTNMKRRPPPPKNIEKFKDNTPAPKIPERIPIPRPQVTVKRSFTLPLPEKKIVPEADGVKDDMNILKDVHNKRFFRTRFEWFKRQIPFRRFGKEKKNTATAEARFDYFTKLVVSKSQPGERPLPLVPDVGPIGNTQKEKSLPERDLEPDIYDEIEIGASTSKSVQCGDSTKQFAELSVDEIEMLFKRYKLSHFAKVCAKEKIDGSFLLNYDLEKLTEKPFSISKHDVKKIKHIIHGQPDQHDEGEAKAKERDFSDLTVNEVCKCFQAMSLTELVYVCKSHMIDGHLLASLEMDDLRKDPFKLRDERIKIVRQIIHGGWKHIIN